jgi:hypothetical protein
VKKMLYVRMVVQKILLLQMDITNLACDELIMKIMWSLFIHRFIDSYILHMNIMHWKYVWHTDKCVDEWTNVTQFPFLSCEMLSLWWIHGCCYVHMCMCFLIKYLFKYMLFVRNMLKLICTFNFCMCRNFC